MSIELNIDILVRMKESSLREKYGHSEQVQARLETEQQGRRSGGMEQCPQTFLLTNIKILRSINLNGSAAEDDPNLCIGGERL